MSLQEGQKPTGIEIRKPNLNGTEFDFGGVKERVITRDDFSIEDARRALRNETIAIVGYGVQGPGQSLNLRDNGFNVIVGQRAGKTFDKAVSDEWVPGRNLFSIEDAIRRATQIQYLLSDAGQKSEWERIRPLLKPGDALTFSHGFSITFKEQTGVIPPPFVDVILVAPKGSGRSVRENFLKGSGINSSFAVFQDATGRARERAIATGMAIGSGFLFPTTFEKEVFSDLTGERGVLMGAFKGLADAGYNSLRNLGFSPEQAATNTIEFLTQTLSKIIGTKGVDGLVRDLNSEQRSLFMKAFVYTREATAPVFEDLYERVATGVESARVIKSNSMFDYRDRLNDELKIIADSESGKASALVREKREKGATVPSSIQTKENVIMAGALAGLFDAQYRLLRSKGHSPSEAFNETVEEATQSLYPLIDRQGIAWMYANCSTTAQRGALDWNGRFRSVLPDLFNPEMHELGGLSFAMTERVSETSEMWRAGKTVRNLRPENQKIA